VFMIDDYVPFYSEYYFKKYDEKIPYYTVRNKDITLPDFKTILSGIKQNFVITSGLEAKYFQLIKDQFPFIIDFKRGFTFEEYVFSKRNLPVLNRPEQKLITLLNFDSGDSSTAWKFDKSELATDSLTGQNVYEFRPERVFGLNFKMPLDEITHNIYQFIDIEAEIKSNDSIPNGLIVTEIKDKENLVNWRGMNFDQFGIKPGTWQKVYLTIDLQLAMHNKNQISPETVFKTYLWNRGHDQFFVKEIKICLRTGNPIRYALGYNIEN